jgi:hypothetical protein
MVSLLILQGGRVMFTEKYSNGRMARRVIRMLKNAGSTDKTDRTGNENVDEIHDI